MKFSIDKHYLVDPLKHVSSALPSKAIIPILSGILFTVNERGLSMTAGNGQVFIRALVETDDFEANQYGSIVLPGNKVVEIVQKSGADITFEAKGLEFVIKSASNKFKITGVDFEDYPEIPDVLAEPVMLSGESFKKLVKKTIFSTAGEKTSTPILTGVHFQFNDGMVRATATDRNRMARTELISETASNFSTVISRESLITFVKIAPDDAISFRFGNDGFLAEMKGLTYYSRVLEGMYPNVDQAIKHSFVLSARFETKSMLSALENVDIIASEEKIHKAKVTIADDMLVESNTEGGDAAVSVELIEVDGDGIVITFNVKYMIEVLKALDSETSIIKFGGKIEPIIISGAEDTKSTYVVLPYRTR